MRKEDSATLKWIFRVSGRAIWWMILLLLIRVLNGFACVQYAYALGKVVDHAAAGVGDAFYRQDMVSGSWMEMTGQNAEATAYLMQEIDPLGCMVYQAAAEVTELDKEKVNGVKCRKFQVRASGESTFLTSAWKEFYYTVWIDKERRLQQAEVIADDHENSGEQLKLTVQFDWNTPVEEIQAPV